MYRLFIRKKEDLKRLYDYFYKDSTIFLERKFLKFKESNIVLTNQITKG